MEVARQLRQCCHYQQHYHKRLVWIFWFLIAIVISKVSHTWIIFPRSERSLPTKPFFERIFTKAFYQYILNLMSEKKLGSFNDWINTYFQSFICLPHNMNIFWLVSFVTFPWRSWTEFNQSRKDLRKTLRSHENIWSVADLSGVNIGFYLNSRDWLFIISKINPLINEQKRADLARSVNSICS